VIFKSMKNSDFRMKNFGSAVAFTLLELMVAIVMLVIALSVAYQGLHGTIRGWRRGTEVVESIQHGNFAMEHLSAALRSTVYFNDAKKSYGFSVAKNSSTYPKDELSFVTVSSAFMPMNSPYQHGAHRITVSIDQDEEGDDALFVSARPHLADVEEYEEEDPWLVSRGIQGLECRIYNEEDELWDDEYEKSNSVPARIELTLYAAPIDEDDEAVVFTRILEIPVAESVEERISNPTITKKTSGGNTVKRPNGTTITLPPGRGGSGGSGGRGSSGGSGLHCACSPPTQC